MKSRRTIMRRLDELYNQKKHEMKDRLNGFNSKFCYQRCLDFQKAGSFFFGFTIHYIDNDWQVKEELLAFKFLEGEHDGKNLSVMYWKTLELLIACLL